MAPRDVRAAELRLRRGHRGQEEGGAGAERRREAEGERERQVAATAIQCSGGRGLAVQHAAERARPRRAPRAPPD